MWVLVIKRVWVINNGDRALGGVELVWWGDMAVVLSKRKKVREILKGVRGGVDKEIKSSKPKNAVRFSNLL